MKIICVVFIVLLISGCASKILVMTDDQQRIVIQKGYSFQGTWQGEKKDFVANTDKIVIPYAVYIKDQEALNRCK